jgi:hypothetical protein
VVHDFPLRVALAEVRGEGGFEETDISDKDFAWWAWGVGVPPDELAATGRTVAADLERQIIADQKAKAATAERAATRAADALETFLQDAYAEIDALDASDPEKGRMKRFPAGARPAGPRPRAGHCWH